MLLDHRVPSHFGRLQRLARQLGRRLLGRLVLLQSGQFCRHRLGAGVELGDDRREFLVRRQQLQGRGSAASSGQQRETGLLLQLQLVRRVGQGLGRRVVLLLLRGHLVVDRLQGLGQRRNRLGRLGLKHHGRLDLLVRSSQLDRQPLLTLGQRTQQLAGTGRPSDQVRRQARSAGKCPSQDQLADETADVVLGRDEAVGEQPQQLGVRGRVVAVVQVHRLNQTAAHHQRPETIRHVAGEIPVVAVADQLGQLLATTVGRDRPQVLLLLVRLDLVLLARRNRRLVQLTLAQQARSRNARVAGEHRLEGHSTTGPLGQYARLLLVGLEEIGAVQEGVDAVVVLLQVIVDQRMVVALGTLQVDAEEHPADLAGHLVHLDSAIHQELRRTTLLGIDRVGAQDLRSQHVPRLVRLDRLLQKRLPLTSLDLAVAATFREHHVEHVGHPTHVGRTAQQAIHGRSPLGRRLVVEKRPSFLDRRDPPDHCQVQATQKLTVTTRLGHQPHRTRRHQPIHLDVQRIGRRHAGRRHHHHTRKDQRGQQNSN